MSLVQQNLRCFEDARIYLNIISPTAYHHPIELLSGATIGQHTRHFIEFYQCLLQQLPKGLVNYDLRQRDLLIETAPEHACAVLDDVAQAIGGLDLEQSIELEAQMDGMVKVKSNVGRELLYNLEHCIHHLAIIKIGLKVLVPDLVLPKDFGVASSTTQYRKEQLCTASA